MREAKFPIPKRNHDCSKTTLFYSSLTVIQFSSVSNSSMEKEKPANEVLKNNLVAVEPNM